MIELASIAAPAAALATVKEVSGAVVRVATSTRPFGLGEVVKVGESALLSEVIALDTDGAVLQVYEDTTGVAPGDTVVGTGLPLSVELGPGLLGQVLDGIGRPLERLAAAQGDFLERGASLPTLDRTRPWRFTPLLQTGDEVTGGVVLGIVPETPALEHRVLVAPNLAGTLTWISGPALLTMDDLAARVRRPDGTAAEIRLSHMWRVRAPRPFAERHAANVLLVTGQRVLDTFFPLARGAAAGLPGGFGTGKTIMQHQLCKWAEADVIVYVGCGERGNEMTEMLRRLPELVDPKSGRPLAERTVLIANTSNMPVAAREASIYSGVTIAEFYRDMGYHVLLLADSTSRWAEALREISGRLGEMPAEESYPPYLSSRLAAFYERAGSVRTLAGSDGSVSLVSAISPAGGDLTEPVTRHTQRFTRTFWTLDQSLASARVFPAISTRESYSEVPEGLLAWWHSVAPDWPDLRQEALALLDEAHRLEATARLVGTESLPDRQQFVLRVARMFEEGFLRQSAFDPRDAFCAPARQCALLRLLMGVRDRGLLALERGIPARAVGLLPEMSQIERAKTSAGDDAAMEALASAFSQACERLESTLAADRAEGSS
jgi:V/A-type H+/Na+-transporting ATPase subunit A